MGKSFIHPVASMQNCDSPRVEVDRESYQTIAEEKRGISWLQRRETRIQDGKECLGKVQSSELNVDVPRKFNKGNDTIK